MFIRVFFPKFLNQILAYVTFGYYKTEVDIN